MLSLLSKHSLSLIGTILALTLVASCGAPSAPLPTAVPTMQPTEPPTATTAPTVTPLPSPTPLPPTSTPVPPTPTVEPTATPAEIRVSVAQSATVIGDKLNLRSAPGTSASVLGQVSKGDSLRVTGRTDVGDWVEVCCAQANQSGWVYAEYISIEGALGGLPVKAQSPQQKLANRSGNPEYPVQLRIPAIGIRAPVEWVGTTVDGQMEVPSDWDTVGWWQPGTVPGNLGAAVMAGHYDRDTAAGAVFWNLGKLKPGDIVYVTRADGQEQKFTVVGKEIYQFDRAPMTRIFGGDGQADLNLITCGGTWNKQTSNYSNRLVVYTHLVK